MDPQVRELDLNQRLHYGNWPATRDRRPSETRRLALLAELAHHDGQIELKNSRCCASPRTLPRTAHSRTAASRDSRRRPCRNPSPSSFRHLHSTPAKVMRPNKPLSPPARAAAATCSNSRNCFRQMQSPMKVWRRHSTNRPPATAAEESPLCRCA